MSGGGLRVALCVARFYEDLARRLERGARETLERSGVVGAKPASKTKAKAKSKAKPKRRIKSRKKR